MNRLPLVKRAQIVGLLVEGNSLRATSRLADVSINTVTKLLVDLGTACAAYHDQHVRGVNAKRVQCDEIWAFNYAKQKNVAKAKAAPDHAGDCWTWTALDSDSKLMLSYYVGGRDTECAIALMEDLAERITDRIQLTTDGHKPYLDAVSAAFGSDVDFAQLVKVYGDAPKGDVRYSPAECVGAKKKWVVGFPRDKHISTSHVERSNLTMRMGMRRFTRLTNGFSKKFENHCHAIALHFMWYNFGRIHKTLRVTPAMQAGLSDRLWTFEDIAGLLG